MGVVEHISDRVAVMYLGGMAEIAESREIYRLPLHPYTIALLSAVPVASPGARDRRKRIILLGDVPSPVNPPSGCRFHTRCWLRRQLDNPERCVTERPAVRDLDPGHGVACHFAEELREGARRERLIAAAAASTDSRTVSDEEVVTPELRPPTDDGGVFDRPGSGDVGSQGGETQGRL
jgi:peptide/nickel transport system ATP-binding protein